jgi:response regulator RpfG family c-di-GMP phosphodiesterase
MLRWFFGWKGMEMLSAINLVTNSVYILSFLLDSYDAMSSTRSYREYMPQDRVRAEIVKNSGTQFDPKVAECMLSIIDDDINYVLHE